MSVLQAGPNNESSGFFFNGPEIRASATSVVLFRSEQFWGKNDWAKILPITLSFADES
jgi:hypothetical protein